jgi:hypothetical protein
MSANSSTILTNLDFDSLKNTYKAYLRSQDKFADYDFDGSNMSVLLDILSYNTYLNSFYLNMVGNEMFMDTAQLKDSVVSHSKELNYTPRSFRSAVAVVNIILTSADLTLKSVVIPKGTTFSTRIGDSAFTFSTNENIVTTSKVVTSSTVTFTAENVTLYEGTYITDTFSVSAGSTTRYLLSNKTVDTTSITVTVLEDVGAVTHTYSKAASLFGLDSNSKVYFIQGATNDRYELKFGDGVIGRKPKDNSLVIIEYRTSSGELPNGAFEFRADGSIDGIVNIAVNTVDKATSGTVSESIDSIKYNAPRHFNTQERAVTSEDYENLLKQNFNEINEVVAYGGEVLDPPQFGKVYVSVDLNSLDFLPSSKKDQYYKYLKSRSPMSIDPVIVSPEYLYVYCESIVSYNINTTNLNANDIKTLAMSSILEYSQTYLNGFNKTLRYSKLVQNIDSAHVSIVSNDTTLKAVKYITPVKNVYQNITVDFGFELAKRATKDISINIDDTKNVSVESSIFYYNNAQVYLSDNGSGIMQIVSIKNKTPIIDVGTCDYSRGIIKLLNFKIDSYVGTQIKLYVTPKNADISSINNTILSILDGDINVSVLQIRE